MANNTEGEPRVDEAAVEAATTGGELAPEVEQRVWETLARAGIFEKDEVKLLPDQATLAEYANQIITGKKPSGLQRITAKVARATQVNGVPTLITTDLANRETAIPLEDLLARHMTERDMDAVPKIKLLGKKKLPVVGYANDCLFVLDGNSIKYKQIKDDDADASLAKEKFEPIQQGAVERARTAVQSITEPAPAAATPEPAPENVADDAGSQSEDAPTEEDIEQIIEDDGVEVKPDETTDEAGEGGLTQAEVDALLAGAPVEKKGIDLVEPAPAESETATETAAEEVAPVLPIDDLQTNAPETAQPAETKPPVVEKPETKPSGLVGQEVTVGRGRNKVVGVVKSFGIVDEKLMLEVEAGGEQKFIPFNKITGFGSNEWFASLPKYEPLDENDKLDGRVIHTDLGTGDSYVFGYRVGSRDSRVRIHKVSLVTGAISYDEAEEATTEDDNGSDDQAAVPPHLRKEGFQPAADIQGAEKNEAGLPKEGPKLTGQRVTLSAGEGGHTGEIISEPSDIGMIKLRTVDGQEHEVTVYGIAGWDEDFVKQQPTVAFKHVKDLAGFVSQVLPDGGFVVSCLEADGSYRNHPARPDQIMPVKAEDEDEDEAKTPEEKEDSKDVTLPVYFQAAFQSLLGNGDLEAGKAFYDRYMAAESDKDKMAILVEAKMVSTGTPEAEIEVNEQVLELIETLRQDAASHLGPEFGDRVMGALQKSKAVWDAVRGKFLADMWIGKDDGLIKKLSKSVAATAGVGLATRLAVSALAAATKVTALTPGIGALGTAMAAVGYTNMAFRHFESTWMRVPDNKEVRQQKIAQLWQEKVQDEAWLKAHELTHLSADDRKNTEEGVIGLLIHSPRHAVEFDPTKKLPWRLRHITKELAQEIDGEPSTDNWVEQLSTPELTGRLVAARVYLTRREARTSDGQVNNSKQELELYSRLVNASVARSGAAQTAAALAEADTAQTDGKSAIDTKAYLKQSEKIGRKQILTSVGVGVGLGATSYALGYFAKEAWHHLFSADKPAVAPGSEPNETQMGTTRPVVEQEGAVTPETTTKADLGGEGAAPTEAAPAEALPEASAEAPAGAPEEAPAATTGAEVPAFEYFNPEGGYDATEVASVAEKWADAYSPGEPSSTVEIAGAQHFVRADMAQKLGLWQESGDGNGKLLGEWKVVAKRLGDDGVWHTEAVLVSPPTVAGVDLGQVKLVDGKFDFSQVKIPATSELAASIDKGPWQQPWAELRQTHILNALKSDATLARLTDYPLETIQGTPGLAEHLREQATAAIKAQLEAGSTTGTAPKMPTLGGRLVPQAANTWDILKNGGGLASGLRLEAQDWAHEHGVALIDDDVVKPNVPQGPPAGGAGGGGGASGGAPSGYNGIWDRGGASSTPSPQPGEPGYSGYNGYTSPIPDASAEVDDTIGTASTSPPRIPTDIVNDGAPLASTSGGPGVIEAAQPAPGMPETPGVSGGAPISDTSSEYNPITPRPGIEEMGGPVEVEVPTEPAAPEAPATPEAPAADTSSNNPLRNRVEQVRAQRDAVAAAGGSQTTTTGPGSSTTTTSGSTQPLVGPYETVGPSVVPEETTGQ